MSPVFTIQFPEYDIADILQKHLPKKDHFSVAIPVSRQQKFYDLLLVNGKSRKSLTIQVKSSRVYLGRESDDYQYYSWHKCFDITDNYSDFYFLYIIYPLIDKKTFRPRAKWRKKILVFSAKEMRTLLRNLKTEKGKPERWFFSFCFNSTSDKIDGGRGFNYAGKSFSQHLLANQLGNLKQRLK
jgi:hypothetical protein